MAIVTESIEIGFAPERVSRVSRADTVRYDGDPFPSRNEQLDGATEAPRGRRTRTAERTTESFRDLVGPRGWSLPAVMDRVAAVPFRRDIHARLCGRKRCREALQ